MSKELKKKINKNISKVFVEKLSTMNTISVFLLMFLFVVFLISGLFGLIYEVILIGFIFDREFPIFSFIESIVVIWFSSRMLWLIIKEIRLRK